MISAKIKNSFLRWGANRYFHKSELVETIASLHSLYAEKSEKTSQFEKPGREIR